MSKQAIVTEDDMLKLANMFHEKAKNVDVCGGGELERRVSREHRDTLDDVASVIEQMFQGTRKADFDD